MTSVRELAKARYGLPVEVEEGASDTVRTLLGHRSCRRFKPEGLSEDLIRLLLSCAQSAPTKSNLQQYSIVATTDETKRGEIASLVPTMPWIAEAPLILVFLGDVRRIRRLAEMRGHDYCNDNADTFMNATIDAALAMQALLIAAESLGLGTCPISYVRNRIDDLTRILKLPDGVFPIAGLTVGWPAAEGNVSLRLPQDIVVHRDVYDDSALEGDIADYDDRAHDHQPLAPAKQRHTDRYGVLEKCTWSENVARQLSVPERDGFAGYLERKKINLT